MTHTDPDGFPSFADEDFRMDLRAEPVDWTDDDLAAMAEAAESEHERVACCPNDPSCPWPDSCGGCGQDWPCEAVAFAAEQLEAERLERVANAKGQRS